MTKVSIPTMPPSSRATNSVVPPVGHDPLQDGAAGRRRGAGELGHEAVDRGAEVVVDRRGGLDRDHDVVDSPRHIGWRTLS